MPPDRDVDKKCEGGITEKDESVDDDAFEARQWQAEEDGILEVKSEAESREGQVKVSCRWQRPIRR